MVSIQWPLKKAMKARVRPQPGQSQPLKKRKAQSGRFSIEVAGKNTAAANNEMIAAAANIGERNPVMKARLTLKTAYLLACCSAIGPMIGISHFVPW